MKRLTLFLFLSASLAGLDAAAAAPVSFNRLNYGEGSYLMQTFKASHPYASREYDGETYSGVTILSEDLQPVHHFSFDFDETKRIHTLKFTTGSSLYINEIAATQYFFNDDDLYEVVVKDSQNDVYRIYNENGEDLGECPATSLFMAESGIVYLYDEYYEDPSTGLTCSALYEVAGSSNNVQFNEISPVGLSVSPNPVGADGTAYVHLPEDVEAGCVVSVMSIDGRLIFSKTVSDPNARIVIPGYMLGEGINPVVVTDSNGNVVAAGKILKN